METGTVVQYFTIFYVVDMSVFPARYGFSEQILHHFIEMVFKSKFFLKFARVPILYCFEANDW